MTEEPQKSLSALVATGLSGIPAALSGSAIGAINRLISGVADIPAAYLNGWKENLEDRNYERRAIRRGLVDIAVEKAKMDGALVDRTVARLMFDQVRKQENREAVALEAVKIINEDIKDFSDQNEACEVSDEWMGSFERFAEDASSEKMRNLWARVLSGEIVKPGSFSRLTLRLIHELDQQTAESFEVIAKYALAGQVFSAGDEESIFQHMLHLNAMGILTGTGGLVQWRNRADAQGRFAIFGDRFGLVGQTDPHADVTIDATPLSQSGREILKIVPNPDEKSTLLRVAEQLKKPLPLSQVKVTGVALGEIYGKSDGQTFLKEIEPLWGDNPFT